MGIFNKIKKTKKTKEKIQNNNNLSYKLAGLYLNDNVDLTPIENKIAENANNITENNNKIVENTNKINEQTNKINEHTLKINEHTTTLNDQNTRINNNINNIATNVNNINNINTKINKITNDLNNANLANYKGLYNNTVNYKLGDLVSDNNTNNVYLSVSNNNINNPLNNNNFWKIITFTVDTSDFITDSSLEPIRNNINNNSSEITNIKNRLDNIQSSRAVFKEFNKQITLYKKSISTNLKMFWYEFYNQSITGYLTLNNLKYNKDYACIVVISQLNNKNINWLIESWTFTTDRNGNYDLSLRRLSNFTGGYLSNNDFKPGSDGSFTATANINVMIWEREN